MLFTKTVLLTILSFSLTAFAAPIENNVADVADVADSCNGSNHYYKCEQGRDRKKQGYYEERHGDYRDGKHDVHAGAREECRNGGSCGYKNGDRRDIRDRDRNHGRNWY